GMTIGITCCLLIALYVQYEFSFDRQHPDAESVYRVVQSQGKNYFKGTNEFALSPCTVVPALRADFPEVAAATTFAVDEWLVQSDQLTEYAWGAFADSVFLDVLHYPATTGDPRAVLHDPNSIAITESFARKHFGQAPAIGQTLQLFDEKQLTVAAILKDLPPNQHFHFDYLTSLHNSPYYAADAQRYKWVSNNYRAYFRLAPGASLASLSSKLKAFDELAAPYYDTPGHEPHYFVQALTDIHLKSQQNMELAPNSDIRYIYLAVSIGILILLLAFINYLNLANARGSQRIKAIGVRKVLGAGRRQVVSQLLTESILTISISFALALGLTFLLTPSFNRLAGLSISFPNWEHIAIIAGLFAAILFVGIIVSSYPAAVAAAVRSVEALKGRRSQHQHWDSWIKNSLVVGQFAAAIILVACTMIIYQQLRYTQEKALGFNREQIVFIPYQDQDILPKRDVIKRQLMEHPNIQLATFGSNLPLNTENQGVANEWEGNVDQKQQPIYRNHIEYDYLQALDIELVAGRNFSPTNTTDAEAAYLLNESAVKALGWESAVGKAFEHGHVVGVVNDYHFQPFQLAIEPMFFRLQNEYTAKYGNIILKLNGAPTEEVLRHIGSTVAAHFPSLPVNLQFLDESYAALYEREQRFGQLFNLFSGLAIFIACLGLFGLITHSVVQRTKEIGIRKVLGASASQLVALLSGHFLIKVLIAAILATPIAWWAMQQWLSAFAYRIDISPLTFIMASLGALGLAGLTTGWQSWRAALQHPAETLKVE
ncbi:MAG: FtsX-like permease family protein, partial [Bacteroidota bacterium]